MRGQFERIWPCTSVAEYRAAWNLNCELRAEQARANEARKALEAAEAPVVTAEPTCGHSIDNLSSHSGQDAGTDVIPNAPVEDGRPSNPIRSAESESTYTGSSTSSTDLHDDGAACDAVSSLSEPDQESDASDVCHVTVDAEKTWFAK